tara:strand:+ start:245 stop:535 length:291 start_codon:yes stop_codon:yes gene_type:complete
MNKNLEILRTMCLTWTDDQVSEAWGIIAEEGKKRQSRRSKAMKSVLKEGDTVTFSGRKAGNVTGTIVRVKRKNAIVSVAGSRNWNVPLSMLKKSQG